MKKLFTFLLFLTLSSRLQSQITNPTYSDLVSMSDADIIYHLTQSHHITDQSEINRIVASIKNKTAAKGLNTLNTTPPTIQAPCTNLDFETGSASGWTTTGLVSVVSTGVDYFGGFPVAHPSGSFSAKLGAPTEQVPATLTQSFPVTSANAILTYQYAIVFLGFPHDVNSAARVQLNVFDQNGIPLPCTQVEIIAQETGATGFTKSTRPPQCNNSGQCSYDVYYKPWTTVQVDLSAYIGQTITIELKNSPCIYYVDWAYSYIDASCSSSQIYQKNICGLALSSLVAPKGFASYTWAGPGIVSGQGTDSVVVNQTGTYTVTLGNTSGCPAVPMTFTVTNLPTSSPIANYSFNNNICPGTTITFNDNSTSPLSDLINQWEWDLNNDGSIENFSQPYSQQFNTTGTFPLKLTVRNNTCSDDTIINIQVKNGIVANFSKVDTCLNQTVIFTNTSTSSVGYSSAWQFGNGQTSTANNPSHNYSSPTNYSVWLKVTNTDNCVDSISKPIQILDTARLKFTTTPNCLSGLTQLNNTTPNANIVTSWSWDVNNDGTEDANTISTSYIFPSAGVFTVNLSAISIGGCTAKLSSRDTIFPSPEASFVIAAIDSCVYRTFNFNNSSFVVNPIGLSTSITSYAWSFGDGNTSSSNNASHKYTTDGVYNIQLIVTTSNGCTDDTIVPLNVYPTPIASFSTLPVCYQATTIFNSSSSSISSGSIVNWEWDLDNNATYEINNTASPSYVYTSSGNKIASLITTSDHNCKDTITNTTIIYPLPTAAFTTSKTCLNQVTNFTDYSTGNGNNITNWLWDFDNNNSTDATSTNASNTYGTTGLKTPKLVVVSEHNCKDSLIGQVFINANPNIVFLSPNRNGCSTHCTTFDNTSTITLGSIASYMWDFGDGITSQTTSNNQQQHCFENTSYNTTRFYDITLTATSDSGCVTTSILPNYIEVYPTPIADFDFGPTTPEPNVAQPLIYFYDKSKGASNWLWDFGDVFYPGTETSTAQNPTYTYESITSNTYLVAQVVSNQYQCSDTIYKSVKIGPSFTFYIPNTFSPNNDGVNDGFRGYGTGITKYKLWIYDRWGNQLFYTEDIDQAWDGKVQGHNEQAQQDVYEWKVQLYDVFNKQHDYVGHVTLIK